MIHDLYSRTAASSAAELANLTPQGADTPIPRSRIRDLHVAIDGRFVLIGKVAVCVVDMSTFAAGTARPERASGAFHAP